MGSALLKSEVHPPMPARMPSGKYSTLLLEDNHAYPLGEKGSTVIYDLTYQHPNHGDTIVTVTDKSRRLLKASRELCDKALSLVCVDFVRNPKLLLEPEYAAPILVVGMKEGWFTGKKLSDYSRYKSLTLRMPGGL